MTNEQLFNWWKPYIGQEVHHKSHIEFKGIIVDYDTSWNKFKIKDVKDYCGKLSETQG